MLKRPVVATRYSVPSPARWRPYSNFIDNATFDAVYATECLARPAFLMQLIIQTTSL